jgi:multiple sugar transport system substrate-binding protein
MRKSLLILTMVVVTFTLIVAACAPQPAAVPVPTAAPAQAAQPTVAPAVAAPTAAPAQAAQPTAASAKCDNATLEIWSPENRDADLAAMKALIASFEQTHPGAKVNLTTTTWEDHFTRLQAAAQAGTMPDILYTWAPSTGGLYQQKLIIPLDDIWQALGENNFGPGPKLELTSSDGHYYGLPVYGYLHVLYYRSDWFEKAGIKPPDTIQDMVAAAKALTNDKQKGIQLYTRGFDSYYVMDLLTSNSVEPLDAQGNPTINNPNTIEVLDALKTLNDGKYTPDGWTAMNMDDAKLAFMNGSAGMLLNSTSFLNSLWNDNKAALDYIKMVPIPIGKGTMRGWAGNAQFAISSQSKQQDCAKEFMKYWFTPEVYKTYMANTVLGFIPLYQPVAQDPAFLEMPRIKPLADLYKEGIKAGAQGGPMLGSEHGPNAVTFQAYNEMLYAQMAEKIYKGEKPADVAKWAEDELKRIISESK